MHDSSPCSTGATLLVPQVVKEQAYANLLQGHSRRSSVSSHSGSDCSDHSSVASNDSELTAATSISPDSADTYPPPSIADILIEDESLHISPLDILSGSRARLSPTAPGHGSWLSEASDTCTTSLGPHVQLVEELNLTGAAKANSQNGPLEWLSTLQPPHDIESLNLELKPPCIPLADDSVPSVHSNATVPQPNSTLSSRDTGRHDLQARRCPGNETGYGNASPPIHPRVGQTNPRRTKPLQTRALPPLQRQEERRLTYVDCLVDTTMKLVAHIWPSSVSPVQLDPGLQKKDSSSDKSVICFRFFIEEVLKRSRASHSTLQVALFYCYKLHRSGRVKADGSKTSHPSFRSLQCGRRMFLCSLILASKFIQDRNYSTRAWSRISSLPIAEINQCEATLLRALNYSIFIRADTFAVWSRQITMCVERSKRFMNPQFCHLDLVVDTTLSPMAPSFTGRRAEVTDSGFDSIVDGVPSSGGTDDRPGSSTLAQSSFDLAIRSAFEPQTSKTTHPSGSGDSDNLVDPRSKIEKSANSSAWDKDDAGTMTAPPAPQLSNASSPTSSPDSDSGHPGTFTGSVLHMDTCHPVVGGTGHQQRVRAGFDGGVFYSMPHNTQPSRLQDGSVSGPRDGPWSPSSAASFIRGEDQKAAQPSDFPTQYTATATDVKVKFSPRTLAADAQAWRELSERSAQEEDSSSDISETTPTAEPLTDLKAQENYYADNPWIEDLENDMDRGLDKQRSVRKPRSSHEHLRRKRSIGKCAGIHNRHHVADREKIARYLK